MNKLHEEIEVELKQPDQTTIECSRCAGRGIVAFNDKFGAKQEKICSKCEGSGEVEVNTSLAYIAKIK